MCKGADPTARDNTFRIFASSPNLVMDLQTDGVLRALQDGLQDGQSIDVCAFICLLPKSRCSFDFFCRSGTRLCGLQYLISRHAISTKSHIPYRSCTRCSIPSSRSLTPTSQIPYQPHTSHRVSRRPTDAERGPSKMRNRTKRARTCKAALEFMINLSEAKPTMVRRTDGWVSAIVRGCLGGMDELLLVVPSQTARQCGSSSTASI